MIERINPAAAKMYLAHVENGMKRAYTQTDLGRLEKALARRGGLWKQAKGVVKQRTGGSRCVGNRPSVAS